MQHYWGTTLAPARWLKQLSLQSANLGLRKVLLEPFTPDFLCASDRKRPALGELLLDGGGGGAGMQRGREPDPLEPRVGLDASCSARNLQCAKHETQHAVSLGLASSLAVSPPACPCLGAASLLGNNRFAVGRAKITADLCRPIDTPTPSTRAAPQNHFQQDQSPTLSFQF